MKRWIINFSPEENYPPEQQKEDVGKMAGTKTKTRHLGDTIYLLLLHSLPSDITTGYAEEKRDSTFCLLLEDEEWLEIIKNGRIYGFN